jgi:hypothetical protein
LRLRCLRAHPQAEERGAIEGHFARVNPKAVDLPLLAFIFVRDEERPGIERTSAHRRHSRGPQVHHVAGRIACS